MKGLFVFSHDMEDVEALGTRALLKRAGLTVDAVTYEKSKKVKTAYGLTVEADYLGEDINPDAYDFLIIPGGPYVAKVIKKDVKIKRLILAFSKQNKLIAAICAGPRFFGQLHLLDKHRFTCYPGSEKDMPQGIYLPEEKAVTDKHIITARGAGCVYDFSYHIVNYTLGKNDADHLFEAIQY